MKWNDNIMLADWYGPISGPTIEELYEAFKKRLEEESEEGEE